MKNNQNYYQQEFLWLESDKFYDVPPKIKESNKCESSERGVTTIDCLNGYEPVTNE